MHEMWILLLVSIRCIDLLTAQYLDSFAVIRWCSVSSSSTHPISTISQWHGNIPPSSVMELDQLTYRWSNRIRIILQCPVSNKEAETLLLDLSMVTCMGLAHVEHCMCYDVASIAHGITSTVEAKLTHSKWMTSTKRTNRTARPYSQSIWNQSSNTTLDFCSAHACIRFYVSSIAPCMCAC
jgi:hypothetical protein